MRVNSAACSNTRFQRLISRIRRANNCQMVSKLVSTSCEPATAVQPVSGSISSLEKTRCPPQPFQEIAVESLLGCRTINRAAPHARPDGGHLPRTPKFDDQIPQLYAFLAQSSRQTSDVDQERYNRISRMTGAMFSTPSQRQPDRHGRVQNNLTDQRQSTMRVVPKCR